MTRGRAPDIRSTLGVCLDSPGMLVDPANQGFGIFVGGAGGWYVHSVRAAVVSMHVIIVEISPACHALAYLLFVPWYVKDSQVPSLVLFVCVLVTCAPCLQSSLQ